MEGFCVVTFLRGWQDFDLIQLVLQPLFLFSATFFPITTYPPALQVVVQPAPRGTAAIERCRSRSKPARRGTVCGSGSRSAPRFACGRRRR